MAHLHLACDVSTEHKDCPSPVPYGLHSEVATAVRLSYGFTTPQPLQFCIQ